MPKITRRRIKPAGFKMVGEKLADLKLQAKNLEEQIQVVQKDLLCTPGCPKKIKTSKGTLNLVERKSWIILDKPAVFKTLTKDEFINRCSISKTAIVGSIGEIGFGKMLGNGTAEQGESSFYFTLKVPK